MKVELLAPAGDLEKLKIAVLYGADAVFIGGEKFSLRARASNFTLEDIRKGCSFAHSHGAKVHVTMNIIPHEDDLDNLNEYLSSLEKCGVDAVIVASPAIITEALKTNMEVHISTQQSLSNSQAIAFWAEKGAKRAVLARELSISEIEEVRRNSSIDLEVFIHGGMCISYSGRCMMSNVMTNRDANRGGCAHSCRWNYDLYDNDKKVNKDGYFAMSSKDLCAVRSIPRLIETGVNSFKIEGRMKSLYYIACIVKSYRGLIDDFYAGKEIDFEYYEKEIKKGENRLTGHGFLEGPITENEQLYDMRSEIPTKEFVGIVLSYNDGIATIEQRNFFTINDKIEIFGPKNSNIITIEKIMDENGNNLDAARHPQQIIKLQVPFFVKPYDMLRLIRE